MDSENKIDLNENEFTVITDKKFLYNLIESSIKKAGNTNKLADIIRTYKIKRYRKRELIVNIKKWQKTLTKRQIPLDVFLSLCDFCSLSPKIKGIRLVRARNNLNIKYPVKLNNSIAFVSELVKVEGHLTKRKILLENTNTELTKRFKEALLNIGIEKTAIKETLHIKIQVPGNIKKEDIKILNITQNKEIKNFYERILDLKFGKKKEIIFTENKFNYDKNIIYKVVCNGKAFYVSFKIPFSGKVYTKSTLSDFRYQKATISLKLEIYNKTLVHLLNKYLEIPYGNKSKIIKIPCFIKTASKEVLRNIISATLAAESTVVPKDKKVVIGSLSKKYLEDFQEILLRFNITSFISKKGTVLTICGFRNFEKINKNFDFIIKSKTNDFYSLLKNKVISSSPKGFSKVLYLKSLNQLGIATALEIRNNAGRKGNSFRVYIKEILDKRYASVISDAWPRKYEISDLGKRFLKANETYWLE